MARSWNVIPRSLRPRRGRATEQMLEQALIEIWRRTEDASIVTWLGRPIWQYPSDAWLLQEMVSSLRPDVVVETGTHRGGSALFFASLFDLLGHGRVVTVDVDPQETPPHDRVTYLTGSSTDPEVVERVKAEARRHGRNVFVMLDSDHWVTHVYAELQAYSDLVPVGGYVHVQDGWSWDGRSSRLTVDGPALAAQQFLAERDDFVRDEAVERRYGVTAHLFGWLRRVR